MLKYSKLILILGGYYMSKIITIGREFGSGGRELGKRLAQELNIAYYDWEIVSEIAKRTELSEEYVQSVIEKHPMVAYPIHTGISFSPLYYNVHIGNNSAIYQEQKKLLIELAEKGDCVIVGRCADYILRDYNPFRIFVYADINSKVERCRKKGNEHEHLTDKQLIKHIKKVDKQRARYYSFYTGTVWGDKLNYDLMLNTTGVDIKEVVPHIAKML
jgi:cytidylate kinase